MYGVVGITLVAAGKYFGQESQSLLVDFISYQRSAMDAMVY